MELPKLLLGGKELPFLEGKLANVSQVGNSCNFNIILTNGKKTGAGKDPWRFTSQPVLIQDGDYAMVYEVPEKADRLSVPILGLIVIGYRAATYRYVTYRYVISTRTLGKELRWSDSI